MPNSPTFLGNFFKGVRIFNFSTESFLGKFYRHMAIFQVTLYLTDDLLQFKLLRELIFPMSNDEKIDTD